MPIYEYDCLDCGQPLEAFQRAEEKPLEICPKCQGRLKKRISLSSFVLKGTGWYKTDYAGSGPSSKETRPVHENASAKKNGKEGNGHTKEEKVTEKAPTGDSK